MMTNKATMDARVQEIIGEKGLRDAMILGLWTTEPYPFISAPTCESEWIVRKWITSQPVPEDYRVDAIGDLFWGRIFENQDPILAALEYQLGDYAKMLLAVKEERDV